MRKHKHFVLWFILAFAVFGSCVYGRQLVSSNSEGEGANMTFTVSSPISNGFVFIEGEYVEAPYVVSRVGLKICINDKVIADYTQRVKTLPKSESTRPARPVDITTQSTPYDKNVGTYLCRMQNYLSANVERDKAASEMEKVLKELPCVKNVQRNNDGVSAIVTYMNGQTDNMALVPPTRKPAITPDTVIAHISRACRDYVERLAKGDFYSFSNNGSRIYTFSASTAKDEMPSIVKVLRSSQNDESKAKQLAGMLGMSEVPKENMESFVTELSTSKQLEERVDALTCADGSSGREK